MMTVGDVPKGKIQSYYMKDNYYFQAIERLETYGNGVDVAGFKEGISEDQIKGFTKNRKTVAKDLTFSAPKSVSLEYALADQKVKKLIEDAHDCAVKKALDYAQNSGIIHYRYKDKAEVKSGEAKNVIFAMTKHEISRECDPQLHTHCLLLNAGFDKLGNNRSLTYKVLMKNQEQLGNVYRHELASMLNEIGYELRVKAQETNRKIDKFYFELKKYDDRVIETFSTRDSQIREMQAKLNDEKSRQGLTPEEVKQLAFYKTRKKKESVDPDELRKMWIEKAKYLGLEINGSGVERSFKIDESRLDEIYNSVRSRQFNTGIVTTRYELLKQVQAQALKEGQPFTIEEFDKRFDKDEKILALTKKSTKPYHEEITSLDLYHSEKRILDLVEKGKGSHRQITGKAKASISAWERREKITLDQDQAKSAQLILETKDFAVVIQGHAGTGKTTLLRAVNDTAVENRKTILGLAPTGQAAKNLENETGIESNTIDSFLRRVGHAELKEVEFGTNHYLEHIKNSTVLVDEASMVDLKKMEHLFDVAEKYKMKVAMIGDRFQFAPVGTGKPYMLIQDNTEVGRGIITEIRRQATPELRSVSESLALRHNVTEAFDKLKELSQVPTSGVTYKEIKSPKDRFKATVNDYLEKSAEDNKTFIMTGTNRNREAFNKEVRYQMRAAGRLEGDDVKVQVMTGKDEAREIGVAKGDRLIFTKNDTSTYDVRNGTTGTVERVSLDKQNQVKGITVALDDGRKVTIDPQVYNKFEHAYSITFHKAQGQTVKSAIISLNSKERLSFNKIYVALTRHKEKISVYADDFAKVAERAKNPEVKHSAFEIHKSRSEHLPKDERLERPYTTQRHDPSASFNKGEGLGERKQAGRRTRPQSGMSPFERLTERATKRLRKRGVQAVLGPEGQKAVRIVRKVYSVAKMVNKVLRPFRGSPEWAAQTKQRENAVSAYATEATMRAIESIPYLGTAVRVIRLISNLSEIRKAAVDQIPVVGLLRKMR